MHGVEWTSVEKPNVHPTTSLAQDGVLGDIREVTPSEFSRF
jgi:hypothetical protein